MNKQRFTWVFSFLILCIGGVVTPVVEAQIVAARVSGTTGQTVTGPPAVVRFDTVEFDTHDAISGEGTSSFKFTAPVDGFYEVGASCLTTAPATAGLVVLLLYHNDAYVTRLAEVNQSGNTLFPVIPGGSTILEMAAGDDVTVYIGGVTSSLDTAPENSNFYVFRVN